jgi:DNA-binding GntR family transcriptional regulator
MTLSQAHSVRAALEDDIVSGVARPGDRLDEQTLARRFGVSRTPVREALKHLEAQGLIQVRPRVGAVVASYTIPKLIEMFEVMAELEGLCARLAARRMSQREKEELERCHKACADAARGGDPDAYYRENLSFHEAIYDQEQTRRLRSLLSPYRRYQLHLGGRVNASYAEHDAIVQAIAAGDADAADRLMHRHVNVQGDTFSDFITAFPNAFAST